MARRIVPTMVVDDSPANPAFSAPIQIKPGSEAFVRHFKRMDDLFRNVKEGRGRYATNSKAAKEVIVFKRKGRAQEAVQHPAKRTRKRRYVQHPVKHPVKRTRRVRGGGLGDGALARLNNCPLTKPVRVKSHTRRGKEVRGYCRKR